VEQRFGEAREHDTAVTEGVGDLPPLLPEQREPEAAETTRGTGPRRQAQAAPEPPLTPQQEKWIDEVVEQADRALANTPSLIAASG
jgi:hypothetical protein